MNPLNTPWAAKGCSEEQPKARPKKAPARGPTAFRGIRTEAQAVDVGAEDKLIITVRGVTGIPSGSWQLRYVPGMALGKYLKRLKLKHAATYAAVYDQNNLAGGRLRLSYVPTLQSRILIGPPAVSSRPPRSQGYDGERHARNMGKTNKGPAPRVVEVSLRYK